MMPYCLHFDCNLFNILKIFYDFFSFHRFNLVHFLFPPSRSAKDLGIGKGCGGVLTTPHLYPYNPLPIQVYHFYIYTDDSPFDSPIGILKFDPIHQLNKPVQLPNY